MVRLTLSNLQAAQSPVLNVNNTHARYGNCSLRVFVVSFSKHVFSSPCGPLSTEGPVCKKQNPPRANEMAASSP